MKSDIENIEDIKKVVDSFYDKVVKDELISKYFVTIAQTNWETHLPKMYAFWAGVLLGQPGFNGRPMQQHFKVHFQEKIQSIHIDRWLSLWHDTLDTYFEGAIVEEAKRRAAMMQAMMLQKFNQIDNNPLYK